MVTSFYTFMKFSYSTKVFSGDQYHAQIFYGSSFVNYHVHHLASDCCSFDFKEKLWGYKFRICNWSNCLHARPLKMLLLLELAVKFLNNCTCCKSILLNLFLHLFFNQKPTCYGGFTKVHTKWRVLPSLGQSFYGYMEDQLSQN